jgi:predicted ATPase
MVAGIESAFVGRAHQLAQFRSSLDRLDEGAGGVVFVVGEAGVGKSRLKTEIRREADLPRLKWLEARTLSYGQNISYYPLKEILQEDSGIDPEDSIPTREQKLRERLERLFADRAGDLLPVLGNLLGVVVDQVGGYEPLRPEEDSARKVLLERLSCYFSRVSTEQPLVLVFEDVHWLDRSSLCHRESTPSH